MSSAGKQGGKNLNDMLRAGGYQGEEEPEGDGGALSGYAPYLQQCPPEVLRRVKALKANQMESLEIEQKFYERVHELEKEFEPLFNAVQARRRAIVSGEHEPSEEECSQPLIHGIPPEQLDKVEAGVAALTVQESKGSSVQGVPSFWRHVLLNCPQILHIIQECDEPILDSLVDVTSEVHTGSRPGFTIHFHFAENPYFTNNVLKKYYELKLSLDEEDPFDYEGPTVVLSQGELINWKEGKNVTVKVVKKKQKKGNAAGKFITKVEPTESFFNFFDPTPKVMNSDVDEDEDAQLRDDFEIGQMLRDQVIPRAVLYYTGEAAYDGDEFSDDEDEDEDEGEDDDDDMDGSGDE